MHAMTDADTYSAGMASPAASIRSWSA